MLTRQPLASRVGDGQAANNMLSDHCTDACRPQRDLFETDLVRLSHFFRISLCETCFYQGIADSWLESGLSEIAKNASKINFCESRT